MEPAVWILLVLLLYAVALGLFLLEIFLPTGGILGVVASVVAILCLRELFILEHTLLATILILLGCGYVVWAISFGIKRMSHDDTLEDGVSTGADVKAAEQLIGQNGVTVTPLRPAGVAKIAGRRYDVVTVGSFVESNCEVSVVETSGNRIIVRPTPADA